MLFFKKDKKDKKDDKVSAETYFSKGQWAEALDAYERLLPIMPSDVKLLRRVADLRAKLGKNAEAVDAYRRSADILASTGFLVQAIAVYKILLRLDPSAEDVAKKLGELYAERGITSFTLEKHEAEARAEVRPAPAQPPRTQPLPRIPLFSDLPEDAFLRLIEDLHARQLMPGDYLFKEGDPGDSIFVIASGGVEVVFRGKVLAALSEGEFFGEGALFSRDPRSADVRAGSAGAELLEVRRDNLEKLMDEYQGVSEALRLFYKKRITDRMLATSSLMTELDSEIRAELENVLEVLNVSPGQVLVQEGSAEQDLYFVTRGRFSVTTLHPVTGDKTRLDTIGPGHFFGEVAMITSGERTATVTADEESEVLKVSREALLPYMERFPVIRKAMEKARDERAEAAVNILLKRKG